MTTIPDRGKTHTTLKDNFDLQRRFHKISINFICDEICVDLSPLLALLCLLLISCFPVTFSCPSVKRLTFTCSRVVTVANQEASEVAHLR